jgi:hypothetical protein
MDVDARSDSLRTNHYSPTFPASASEPLGLAQVEDGVCSERTRAVG